MRISGRWVLAAGLGIGLLSFRGAVGVAQFSEAPEVPQAMLSAPALRPPMGAKVAIVEFGDLECPLCAAWNPVLAAEAAKYRVPWVRHDFLIRSHNWSRQAAVNARWFDTRSTKLGSDYRNAVFAQQRELATQQDLVDCTERFARAHGVGFPFAVDPQGKLEDAVNADCRLGIALGVNETPTVWVVTAGSRDGGYRFVRVKDVRLLSVYLDQAVGATR
jgi:protein-disulfide isomerase